MFYSYDSYVLKSSLGLVKRNEEGSEEQEKGEKVSSRNEAGTSRRRGRWDRMKESLPGAREQEPTLSLESLLPHQVKTAWRTVRHHPGPTHQKFIRQSPKRPESCPLQGSPTLEGSAKGPFLTYHSLFILYFLCQVPHLAQAPKSRGCSAHCYLLILIAQRVSSWCLE